MACCALPSPPSHHYYPSAPPAGTPAAAAAAFRARVAEVKAQLAGAKSSNRLVDDNLAKGIDQVGAGHEAGVCCVMLCGVCVCREARGTTRGCRLAGMPPPGGCLARGDGPRSAYQFVVRFCLYVWCEGTPSRFAAASCSAAAGHLGADVSGGVAAHEARPAAAQQQQGRRAAGAGGWRWWLRWWWYGVCVCLWETAVWCGSRGGRCRKQNGTRRLVKEGRQEGGRPGPPPAAAAAAAGA